MSSPLVNCLLCHDLLTIGDSGKKYPLQDTLTNQLTVMFLFRKLLQISSENCVSFLQNGENPSSWVIFCHSCTSLIGKAEKVHKRILALKADLRSFQQQIENLICKKLQTNRLSVGSMADIWSMVEKHVLARTNKNISHGENRNIEDTVKKKVKVEVEEDFLGENNHSPECVINAEELEPSCMKRLRKKEIPQKSTKRLSLIKKTASSRSQRPKTESHHKCKRCNQRFSKMLFLKRHSLSVHFTEFNPQDSKEMKSSFLQCPSCIEQFANDILLRGHIRSVHEGKRAPFECPHCKKEYNLYEYVTEHYQTEHVKDGGFLCDKCSQRFCDMETLNVHLLDTHENDPKPFKCSKCSRAFTKHNLLAKHDQVVHKIEKKTFKCDLCPMAFINVIKLKGHQIVKHYIELGLKPIVCEECNWHFVSQKMLDFHKKRKHFKDFNFFCPHCSKGYAVKSNLDAHVVAFHSSGKTHVCPTCEKAFQSKLRLKIHMRRHTNEKIHMCAMCPKIFSERRLLTRHELTAHVDQEKVSCPFCPTEKLFKAKRYLDIHMKSKHAKDVSMKSNEQRID